MSDKPEGDLIAYAITETFGGRCPDYEETCPCCKAWGQYDALAAAEQRGVEKERERCAKVANDEASTGLLGASEAQVALRVAAAIRRGEG